MVNRADLEAIAPLSPIQEGLLFHALCAEALDPYFAQSAFRLEGPLDVAAFRAAWQRAVDRHAILRTAFAWKEAARPLQIALRRAALQLAEEDWRDAGAELQRSRLAAYLDAERRRAPDWLRPPLLRLALLRTGARSWIFVCGHPHVLLDGWSLALLLEEVALGYEAALRGEEPRLPAAADPGAYLRWLQTRDMHAAEAWWRARPGLGDPPTALPLPAPAALPGAGELPCLEVELALGRARSEALRALGRRLGVTLGTLVQGAWALLLARASGARRVGFGATVSGRPAELPGSGRMLGLFINTLPLWTPVPPERPLGAWLAELQSLASELRELAWTPLPALQRWSGRAAAEPLFESVVVFNAFPESGLPQGGENGLAITPLAAAAQAVSGVPTAGRNHYPLTLVVEAGEELQLALCFQRRRFEAAAAARLLPQLVALLDAMAERPQARLAELAPLSAAQRRQALVEWNPAGPAAAVERCVHELCREHALRDPHALALVCEQESLSRGELERRANRLAWRLRGLGVGPEVRVGLCLERSAELVVGILAVLKAGGAYVPLDPALPRERLAFMLKDSGAQVVLAVPATAAALAAEAVRVIALERERAELDAPGAEPPPCATRPANLAYVIYTSGSTGRPKGVAVEHRQLASYAAAVLERLALPEAASLAVVSTPAADLGHTTLFGALLSGRPLHVISAQRGFDPEGFAAYMEAQRIDVLKIAPSHLRGLLAAARPERVLPRRALVLGGEPLRAGLAARVRELAPGCALVNHYGPTETTVGALTWRVEPAELEPGADAPLGRPLRCARAYVLDAGLSPAPVGVAGELYLGGAGVARGYLERPELTAERFVPDPFSSAPGQRLYRSGDRARYRPGGAIEFLGRTDHQLKLRGFRIELGEIEARLHAQPGVAEALVVARGETDESHRLVAYVVPVGAAALEPAQLHARLQESLPEPMLPSAIVVLAALPLGPNGKVDRAALPDPEAAAAKPREESVAPRSALERTLAAIWCEVLERESVGVNEDFFALGGDSIRSLQIIARGHARGLRLTPKQVFAHRTIGELVRALGEAPAPAAQARTPEPPAERVPFALCRLEAGALAALRREHGERLEDVYPASPAQQGMLFHAQLEAERSPYFNQIVCRFRDGLDTAAFEAAVRELCARHAILRTAFSGLEAGEAHQLVLRGVQPPLERLDWRGRSEAEQAAALAAYLRADRARGFDFAAAPLLRLARMRIGGSAEQLVWSVHHAILDGWCQALLLREWLELYQTQLRGEGTSRPPAPPFRDYIAWLARQDGAAAERFWRAQLRGFRAPLRLPEPTGARRAAATEGVRELRTALAPPATAALQELARRQGITLATAVQAAWALLLARWAAADDVVFGIAVAGRPAELPGAEAMVGVFINSLPLRLRIARAQPLADWLQEIQALQLELRQHEWTPLVQVQGWSELARGESLFETLLVFQNYPLQTTLDAHAEALGLELRAAEAWTNYPLTLFAEPGESLALLFSYDPVRIDPAALSELAAELPALLERMAQPLAQRLADLFPRGGPAAQLLRGQPERERGSGEAESWLARLEAQRERTPRAVALECGDARLDYAELHGRADALAHRLEREGAGPDVLVGLCAERTPQLLIGLLAILKAGAAYLPLDPDAPRERLRAMLDDASPRLLLAGGERARTLLSEALPRDGRRVLALDADPPPEPFAGPRGAGTRAGGEALAYAIYTSGSTGRPKGVLVRRSGLWNFLDAMLELLRPEPGAAWLATTSLGFDIAALELLLPLAVGARIVLADRATAADGERLAALLRSSGARWLQATPTAWRLLLTSGRAELAGVRALCGGEACTPELARRIRAAGAELWNLYGPTETTVWSSAARVTDVRDCVPLGQPLACTQLHVLDSALEPVPPGVAGELWIGGAGLARGYWRRPELTAQSFVPDPFAQTPGARLYRTGDRVRLRRDGALEFLGRADQQVKLRGWRIELGEIEVRLREHPALREAAVLLREAEGDGGRLVAHVALREGAQASAEALRAWLAQTLPAPMLPAHFVFAAALPVTPSGKLDRRALAAAPLTPEAKASAAAPRSATERRLAQLWAPLLGVASVGADAHFFALGGHSLLAAQAAARIRSAFGVELPLRALFEQPVLASLAAEIDRRREAGAAPLRPPLEPASRGAALPLSFAQQRLWFLAQLEPGSAAYNMPAAVHIEGPLDAARLRESFAALARRHESLRTTFRWADGAPVQLIAAEPALDFTALDWSAAAPAGREDALRRAAAEEAGRPFDLERGPLLRTVLLRLAAEQHVLLVVLHHITADGWSFHVLVEELAELYAAAAAGRPAALAPLRIQYADFALWQRAWLGGALRETQRRYWRERLRDAPPPLPLPLDRPRSALVSSRGGNCRTRLGRARTDALRALGEREGATLFMTLLAAYALLLGQRSGRTDLWIGTDVANRGHIELERLIGFFVNLLVLRLDLGGAPSFRELVRRARETALGAFAHQDLPFEQVVEAVGAAREPGVHPLVQTLFVLQNAPAAELTAEPLRLRALDLGWEASRFDLAVFVEETAVGLEVVWRYRAELFEATTVAGLAAQFERLLEAIVAEPDASASALARAAAPEKERSMTAGPKRLRDIKPRTVTLAPELPQGEWVRTRPLREDGPLPLLIEPALADLEPVRWAHAQREFLEAQLLRHGALLLRGFALAGIAEFERLASAVCGELFGEYGDLPREKSGEHVYGSTPYPADRAILFHNESSHLPRWPLKQWFYCVQASPQGGATPLVDGRRLVQALPAELRERLAREGLRYVRCFTPGYDVSWQDFFQTPERARVEERCRASGLEWRWVEGERLQIAQRGPALLRHPKSGEWVLFNQIPLHHPAFLEAPVRESLLALLGEAWLPRSVYYGDGSPIDDATARLLGELYERHAVRFPWHSGDVLLLDNMLVAHGRDPFAGPRKIVVAMGEMLEKQSLEAARP